MNRKKKQIIDCTNIPSARFVPHGEDLPITEPPKVYFLISVIEEEDTKKSRISRRRTYRSTLPRSSI
jgi:hypothetical protein